MTRSMHAAGWTLFLCAASTALGCAGLPISKVWTELPDARQSQEQQEMLAEYEQKRDQALFEAAQSRLAQGDEQTCRTLLDQLLQRTPQHRAGRLLKADLCLLDQQFAEAQSLVAGVLAEQPDDAAAQHAMGIVLAAQGKPEAAHAHFTRAAQAEPSNEIYALSLQYSGETLSAPRSTASTDRVPVVE